MLPPDNLLSCGVRKMMRISVEELEDLVVRASRVLFQESRLVQG